MNIYGLASSFFDLIASFPPENNILTSSLMNSLASGITLGGVVSKDKWLHVAYQEDLSKSWIDE